jgi:hypothetical protein
LRRGLRIFAAVVYFLMVSVIGIFIALIIPQIRLMELPFDKAQEALDAMELSDVVRFTPGYYDSDIAYFGTFNDVKIAIFRAAPLIEDEQGLAEAKMTIAYEGYLFNIGGKYEHQGEENNETKLVYTDSDDVEHIYKLVRYDVDGNEVNDAISTLYTHDFVYFEIHQEDTKDLKTFKFIDKNGDVFASFNDLNLDFNHQFFIDVKDFKDEYNKDFASIKLQELEDVFLSKNSTYRKNNYDDIKKEADRSGVIFIIIYFVIAFMIGDCLVGKRYIIKLIKIIVRKIRKDEKKEVSDDGFSNDYYTNVTVILEVPDDCEDTFVITYHNVKNDVEFNLTKVEGYKTTKRVHAGVYVNAFVESVEGKYKATNLPTKLDIRGFTKTFVIKFERINKNKI